MLAAADGYYICEGETAQTSMANWVQEACKAAGLAPDQKIQLAYWPLIVTQPHHFES